MEYGTEQNHTTSAKFTTGRNSMIERGHSSRRAAPRPPILGEHEPFLAVGFFRFPQNWGLGGLN
jgi:hypothetical protein